MQTLEDSLDFLAEYIISTEYSFVVDEMSSFSDCAAWIDYVLAETAYGAANIVVFRSCSNSEMLRDLEQLWDNCQRGAESIKAARYAAN